MTTASELDAAHTVAGILSGYLPGKLNELTAAAGLPSQNVTAVATGRHIRADVVGQVGVWVEDSELREQHMNGVDYEDVRIVVRAAVNVLDAALVDDVRSVWAAAIKQAVKQRFRVSSPARFFALHRIEDLDDQASVRSPGLIRGVLGQLGVLRQSPTMDAVVVRFTLGQRVVQATDV